MHSLSVSVRGCGCDGPAARAGRVATSEVDMSAQIRTLFRRAAIGALLSLPTFAVAPPLRLAMMHE